MTARIVFRDAAGRVLTTQDLEGFTGKGTWEVTDDGQVPEEARLLHRQGQEAGGRGGHDRAFALFGQAQALAPTWAYPPYDAAFTALLQGDTARAEALYEHVDGLAPRGFFTCKTTLDMLRRERAGDLFDGFSRAFVQLEWLNDPEQKRAILTGIVERYPHFPPAWKELAALLTDDGERLQAIEKGLAGGPDPGTRGMLLINKAAVLHGAGDRDGAVRILGEVALDPDSTLGAETLAKTFLARIC